LRPTLFLAQLSNLLAGNISIVHKVTGSSRTFMGEEGAGVSAIATAFTRIRSGQATHVIVGGAFQSEHPDMLLGYELGGYLHRAPHESVWQRGESAGGGIISGSGSAFIVMESREHADKRGRKPYAELLAVTPGRTKRGQGFDEAMDAMIGATIDGAQLVISGASGSHAATAAEKAALDRRSAVVRGYSTLTGHLKEAQFFVAVALAALSLSHRKAPAPFDASEKPFEGDVSRVLATGVGYHYFEGMALLAAAE
jgi:3-oxoacyl-[acyl-carrier-protein] synthase II